MARQIQSSRTKSFLLLLITVVIGVGLNFFGRLVNEILSLPLYLDNVGTLLSAMTGGLVPGITVGFFSNLINGLNDPNSTYYAVISILIAVTVVICKKRGMMTRLPQVLLAVVFFALIGGGLVPLGRWGQPEDVAKAVVALCDGTFGYTTGCSVTVDGGMHIRRL